MLNGQGGVEGNPLVIWAIFLAGLPAEEPRKLPDMSIRWTVQAPQEIVPAVTEYIGCLQQAVVRISQEQSATNSDAMRRVVMLATSACAETRRSARAKTIDLLGNDAAAVETIFAAVDAQLGQFPDAIKREEQDAKSPAG